MRNQPIDAFFCTRQITYPAEDRSAPDERDGDGYGVSRRQPADALACQSNCLVWISKKPENPRQYDAQALVVEAETLRLGRVRSHASHDCRFNVGAGRELISNQVMGDTEQHVGDSRSDRITERIGDGLTSSGKREHSIEITRTPVKHVYLADEAKLVGWIE